MMLSWQAFVVRSAKGNRSQTHMRSFPLDCKRELGDNYRASMSLVYLFDFPCNSVDMRESHNGILDICFFKFGSVCQARFEDTLSAYYAHFAVKSHTREVASDARSGPLLSLLDETHESNELRKSTSHTGFS